MLPITCCWLQLVRTVKNLFTRVAFIWSGLDSVMYFSWGYTLRHSRNGREWGYLLIKYGRIFLFKEVLKKVCPKINVCLTAYTKYLHFSQKYSWPTVGTVRKYWEAGQREKIVIIAQSGFSLEMINRCISILGLNSFCFARKLLYIKDFHLKRCLQCACPWSRRWDLLSPEAACGSTS